jgi:hypothetical protein
MRYFEIAKPSARHILADADPRGTALGQPRNGTIETAGERCLSNLLNGINRPSRQQRLSPQRSQ